MNRWSALAVALAFAAGLALRVPNLAVRPLHNDEAVNAIKATELWERCKYAYDPDEYHGPTLHYASVPFFWLSGAKNADELRDEVLRWPTVAFGVGLILLLPLFASGIGRKEVAWAAIFMAVSPAMVFYSRYFIHEMLLVFFSAMTIGAGWKWVEARCAAIDIGGQERKGQNLLPSIPTKRGFWAAMVGAGVGLMFATKETFVLSVGAMALAVVGTIWWMRREGEPPKGGTPYLGAILVAAVGFLVVWLSFFSSFFTNWHGLGDSVRTYMPWLKRAGGHSPHIHPWYFYLQRLVWFHPVKGPAWSEAAIVGLAIVGGIVSLRRKTSRLAVFLVIYTVLLTAIYSAISYKTPWCLLNFLFGIILLAGIGAATLADFFGSRVGKTLSILVLVAFAGQLAWQAWRAGFLYAADRRNPYVYAQTVPDLLNLVAKVEGVAKISPTGYSTVLKVISPDGDYWPLPWYLRRFKQAGWYDELPDDPFAPIIIVSSKFDARLDEKSEKKWVMVGLTELRPRQFLELYVELELWKKYVATLPPERE
jgi:uncharacterized protein (TIGR03663 family)